jgi:uncharacterized membrane protein
MTTSRTEVRGTAAVGTRRWPHRVPWVLAAGGVLTQVAFPLTGGGTFVLTVAAVVLLAGASLSHAWVTRGPGAFAALAVVAGGGAFVAEAVGLRTGLPFGAYDYTGSLGREVLGVPLLVPLAWTMMAWPALLVARRLTAGLGSVARPAATALVAAWALTAWDVFLDPQMVEAGHWVWADPSPALPGVPGIPLTNFAGWLVVSLLITASLDRLVPTGDDAAPVTVYLWTFFSSVMANAVFFGRPSVALVGALLMGVVAVPLCRRLYRGTETVTRR